MNKASFLFEEISDKQIQQIFWEKLGMETLKSVSLLDGGLFNTTYLVQGEDQIRYVLRLGPVNRHLLLDFEQNLMEAEVTVYQLCRENGIFCPNILVCDTEKELLDRDYMIMEYIPAKAMSSLEIGAEDRSLIYQEVGTLVKCIHAITGKSFGHVSQICSGKGFGSWEEFVCSEMEEIMGKLAPHQVFTSKEEGRIRAFYRDNIPYLSQIKQAKLQHSDLWDGNLLVSQEEGRLQLKALIDADRAVFGDVDYDLATPWITGEAFYRGYGKHADFESDARKQRRQVYLAGFGLLDVYVNLVEYNQKESALTCKENLMQKTIPV